MRKFQLIATAAAAVILLTSTATLAASDEEIMIKMIELTKQFENTNAAGAKVNAGYMIMGWQDADAAAVACGVVPAGNTKSLTQTAINNRARALYNELAANPDFPRYVEQWIESAGNGKKDVNVKFVKAMVKGAELDYLTANLADGTEVRCSRVKKVLSAKEIHKLRGK